MIVFAIESCQKHYVKLNPNRVPNSGPNPLQKSCPLPKSIYTVLVVYIEVPNTHLCNKEFNYRVILRTHKETSYILILYLINFMKYFYCGFFVFCSRYKYHHSSLNDVPVVTNITVFSIYLYQKKLIGHWPTQRKQDSPCSNLNINSKKVYIYKLYQC